MTCHDMIQPAPPGLRGLGASPSPRGARDSAGPSEHSGSTAPTECQGSALCGRAQDSGASQWRVSSVLLLASRTGQRAGGCRGARGCRGAHHGGDGAPDDAVRNLQGRCCTVLRHDPAGGAILCDDETSQGGPWHRTPGSHAWHRTPAAMHDTGHQQPCTAQDTISHA